LQFTWTSEASTLPETEPKFRMLELEAWQLTGYLLLSNPLAQDSPGIDEWLKSLISDALGWYEDLACLNTGTGVAQPLSILKSGALLKITSRNTSSHIKVQDVASMWTSMIPSGYPNAIWLCSPTALSDIAQLGTSGQFFINADGGGPDSPAGFLLSRPLFVSEKLPALGTSGDLLFIDPSKYVVGDRDELGIDISMDQPTAFLNNQQVWRIVRRVDGQPMYSKTITLQDGTSTVSPFVAIP
jgi:HK97 family phage major capsid protein